MEVNRAGFIAAVLTVVLVNLAVTFLVVRSFPGPSAPAFLAPTPARVAEQPAPAAGAPNTGLVGAASPTLPTPIPPAAGAPAIAPPAAGAPPAAAPPPAKAPPTAAPPPAGVPNAAPPPGGVPAAAPPAAAPPTPAPPTPAPPPTAAPPTPAPPPTAPPAAGPPTPASAPAPGAGEQEPAITFEGSFAPRALRVGQQFVVTLIVTNRGPTAINGLSLFTTGGWSSFTVRGVEPGGKFAPGSAGWNVDVPATLPPGASTSISITASPNEPGNHDFRFIPNQLNPLRPLRDAAGEAPVVGFQVPVTR